MRLQDVREHYEGATLLVVGVLLSIPVWFYEAVTKKAVFPPL